MEYELTRLAADQLAKEMKEERVFQGFSEMDVTFWPTYRFLRQAYGEDGERKYDDGKQRVPSWCDRILWKAYPSLTVTPVNYYSVPSVPSSDHIPVVATFSVSTIVSPHILSSALMQDPFNERCFGTLCLQGLKAIGIKWRSKTDEASEYDPGTAKFVDRKKAPSPYLHFHSSFLPRHIKYQSQVETKTETPNWGDIELPVVGIPCLAYLATQHLIVEVLSMEQGRSTTMEALGQCVISVKGVSDTTGQRFNEPVMLNGEVVAYMAGSLLLKNKAPDFVTM